MGNEESGEGLKTLETSSKLTEEETHNLLKDVTGISNLEKLEEEEGKGQRKQKSTSEIEG